MPPVRFACIPLVAFAALAQPSIPQIIGTIPSGLAFYAFTPCRIADTRNSGGMLAAGSTRTFTIAGGACGAPVAQAYSLNITAVPPGPLGYLTAWPTGQTQPYVSTLNSLNGAVIANAAVVPAGPNGQINIYLSDASHIIIDINGYFGTPSAQGLAFYPVTPCRIADTRATSPIPAQGTRSFPMIGACGLPASANAYSLNVTAVPPAPLLYLTTWPSGQSQPVVSTLNALEGQIAANAAIVPAGANGAISVYVSDTSNVILDVNGYFAPPGGAGGLYFYPVTPCRVADTRSTGPNISIVSGNGQVVCPGCFSPSFFYQPMVVLLTDANGNPLPGATVNWSVGSGAGGIITQSNAATYTATTDSSGHSQATFQLSNFSVTGNGLFSYTTANITASTATQSVSFTLIDGLQDPSADGLSPVSASALQGTLIAGQTFSGQAGTAAATPIKMGVFSESGQGVPNVAVFLVDALTNGPTIECSTTASGAVAGGVNVVLTDSTGLANCYPTFGGSPGSGIFYVDIGGAQSGDPTQLASAYKFCQIPVHSAIDTASWRRF